MIPAKPEERAQWLDLAQRYSFLYDCSLEEGMISQRQDIGAWWCLGGLMQAPGMKPAGPTLTVVNAGPSHASVTPSASSRRFDPPPAPATVAEPEPHAEGGFERLPPAVRDIIRAVAEERGVPVEKIMGWQKLAKYADARQECYRRLRKMPWRGDHPSLLQIGIWLHRDHSTVLHGIQKG